MQISNFMQIRPVGAELFQADGRTDMTKLTVALRNFANATKNSYWPNFLPRSYVTKCVNILKTSRRNLNK